MSNNRNLGNIATAITNATSGQVLTSQGNGVATFADAGGTGVTVHNNQAAMLTDAVSADEGSLHYETANNKLYVKQSSGFFLLASITNTAPTVSGFTETTGSGSATTISNNGTFELTSGSNTVITLTATDPDLETLVYSATVTSGTASNVISSPSLPISNQSGNTFTLTPVTSGSGGTVTIRFDVSDGNNVVNKTHSFSIAFQVVDSNHTTLLATAVGTSDNNNITDSSTANSGSGHNITVNSDAYAGTFSPYRSGGYSTFFNTATSQNAKIDLPTTAFNSYSTSNASTSNFTIQAMIYPTGYADAHSWGNSYAMAVFAKGNVRVNLGINSSGYLIFHHYGTSANDIVGSSQVSLNEWSHVAIICTNGSLSLKLNGTQIGTGTWTGVIDPSASAWVGAHYYNNNGANTGNNGYFKGYITDFKISSVAETITEAPTERLVSDSDTELLLCHLPYIADGSSNSVSVTPDDVSTKPFSPYDYAEYSAADNGGSVYFDGSDDAIGAYHASNLQLGASSAFTLEFWFYANGTSSDYQSLFSTYSGSSVTDAGQSARLIFNTSNNLFILTDGSSNFLQITKDVPQNVWNHFCWTRDASNDHKFYLNGEQIGTSTTNTNFQTDWWYFAQRKYNGDQEFTGYISDISLIKGSVTRTSAFTPPTAPLSSSGTSLHIKGTDASIIDKAQGVNLKLIGNTTGSTTQTKFSSTKSMYFDGTDDYITIAADEIPDLGAEDWTIETWFYTSNLSADFWILSQGDNGNNLPFSRFKVKSDGGTQMLTYSGGNLPINLHTTAGEVTANTWHHIALTHEYNGSNGGTWRVYIDGSKSSVTNGNDTYTSGYYWNSAGVTGKHWEIGKDVSETYNISPAHYLQDLRITVGKARYTASDETSNIPSAPLKG